MRLDCPGADSLFFLPSSESPFWRDRHFSRLLMRYVPFFRPRRQGRDCTQAVAWVEPQRGPPLHRDRQFPIQDARSSLIVVLLSIVHPFGSEWARSRLRPVVSDDTEGIVPLYRPERSTLRGKPRGPSTTINSPQAILRALSSRHHGRGAVDAMTLSTRFFPDWAPTLTDAVCWSAGF
jgi:hypothetical protein